MDRTIDICGHKVRVLEQADGSLLYNAKDLCDALGESLDDALAMLAPDQVVITRHDGTTN